MPKKNKDKSVTETKMFITENGNLFSERDLKRFEMPESNQIDKEVEFGKNTIDTPYNQWKLMNWILVSVVHSSCVRAKVGDSVGIGWKLSEIEDVIEQEGNETDLQRLKDFFNKCNEREDITQVCTKVALDYEGCGNGYFEVVRNVVPVKGEDGIKALYHVNATSIRWTRTLDRFIQQIGRKEIYFKCWGEERNLDKHTGKFKKEVDPEDMATEIIHIKQYTHKSPFYGAPDWLPALIQMFGDIKEKEYNLDFFSNFGIPAYAVVFEGTKLDKDAKEEIQKYFEVEVKKNPHRTMIFNTPDGGKIKFEKLSVDQKEASFRIYRKDNRDDILTAHRVPPYRASIVEKGALGGSVSEDMDRIYLDSVINPRQRAFTWVLNELLIWEGFGLTKFRFDFDDIDIRDREAEADIDEKYFRMGARTPNQILIAQGKETYDGGNSYYVPSTFVPVGEEEVEEKKKDSDGDNAGKTKTDTGKNNDTGDYITDGDES